MSDLRLKKISVLLENQEFERFQGYCDKNGYKKSTLVARLIRDYLDKEGFVSARSRAHPTKQTKSEVSHGQDK